MADVESKKVDQTPSKDSKFPKEFDLYVYVGGISMHGYKLLCDELKKKKHKYAVLALTTPGGDPHAAFRIARALQHEYPENGFVALVSGFCKSAGTLIVCGARALYMADRSELGPLDVQVRKGDELFARNSGLEIFEAITFLQNQTLNAFRDQARALTALDGLSTKISADIATRLTRGIFEPIAAQIDPIKLAEMQRANDITMGYGMRLAEVGKNVQPNGLGQLIGAYPSHGFVIDRKEARSIFAIVHEPTDVLLAINDGLMEEDPNRVNMHPPEVRHVPIEAEKQENKDGQPESQGDGSPSPTDGNAPLDANGADGAAGKRASEQQPTRNSRKAAPAATAD